MYQREVENKDTGFQTLEQNCFALRIGEKITHDVVSTYWVFTFSHLKDAHKEENYI